MFKRNLFISKSRNDKMLKPRNQGYEPKPRLVKESILVFNNCPIMGISYTILKYKIWV